MKYLAGIIVLFCAVVLWAEELPDTPTTGGWCGDFHAAKSFVDGQDVALALIWGRDGCDHCTELHDQLFSGAGLQWAAAQRNVVFCWVDGDSSGVDKGKNVGAKEFALGTEKPPYTPVVRFYWLNRKTVAFSGWNGMMYSTSGDTLLAQFQNSLKKFMDEATPIVPTAARFPMGTTACDRLEFILGGTGSRSIDVPVVRATGLDAEAKGAVAVLGTIGSTEYDKFKCEIKWNVGEKLTFARFELSDSDFRKGLTLILRDGGGKEVMRSSVAGVTATPENSAKNPYWLGEKTAETLAWGEWTMDLAAVTNKVRAYNGTNPAKRAYAMMLVEGSCWCPDCAMTEANFFNKQGFKDWAKAKQVVFGVIDIPNNPQDPDAYPTLLRYDSYRTSDDYVTLRGTVSADETQRYQSGAGYLSRHGIAYADALAVAERNAFLVGHDTLHGGWNEPPTKRSNQDRTGAPVLILLRDDGTVAARWNRFSELGGAPTEYSDGYLRRFEEMMAQVDDPEEEADDDRSTTRRTISDRDAISSTVSAVDQADFYRIDIPENRTVKFTVTGRGQGELAASIVNSNGTTVASATGLATEEGFTLETRLTESGNFLKIAPAKIEDEFFSYTKNGSTVCDYSVIAEAGETAGTFGFVVAATNVSENCGEMLIEVSRTKGSFGPASVDVKLVSAKGEGIAERIEWTDTTLSWTNGETDVKSAVLKVKNDGSMRHDMKLEFGLENLKYEAESGEIGLDCCRVNIYDTDYFGMPILKYVAAEDWREIADYLPGDEIDVELKTGELPEGLDISDADGKVGVIGHAVAEAGEYAAVYSVILKRGGVEVSRQEVTFEFTVIDYDFSADIPSLESARNYGNLPLVDSGRVCGVLTVDVPPDGLLSAKYVSQGGSFAYAAKGWSSFDAAEGRLTAELTLVTDPSSCMTVTLSAAGGVVSFNDPGGVEMLEFALDPNVWPEGALPWRGQYTVQLPQTNVADAAGTARLGGSAYMAMRMTSTESVAAGRMLYAGVLPNGRPFYGSSVLLADGDNAVLPFFHASDTKTAPFVFAGGLAIAKNASETFMTNPWSVTAKWTPEWEVPDALGRMADFNVYGGYYDEDRIWDLFNRDFTVAERSKFYFMVGTDSLVSGRYGQGTESIAVQLEMTTTNMPKFVDGAANPHEVEFEFVREVGVVRGAFLIPFGDTDLAVTYRGIALPGWQSCMGCSIGGDAVERPWAVGACSFSDRQGRNMFRNGCEVILGKRK